MTEIIQINNDLDSELPDGIDLGDLTQQILSLVEDIEKSFFQIGRRLKYAKESLPHGAYKTWVENDLRFHPSTASRFIKAHEQFGNIATSQKLGTGKMFEMLALPENMDRQEFLEGAYMVPSAGKVKTVEQMTVKELREVTKPLKEAEKKIKTAEKSQDIIPAPNKHEFIPTDKVNNDSMTDLLADYKDLVKSVRGLLKYDFLLKHLEEINTMEDNTKNEFNLAANLLHAFATGIGPWHEKPRWEGQNINTNPTAPQ